MPQTLDIDKIISDQVSEKFRQLRNEKLVIEPEDARRLYEIFGTPQDPKDLVDAILRGYTFSLLGVEFKLTPEQKHRMLDLALFEQREPLKKEDLTEEDQARILKEYMDSRFTDHILWLLGEI